MTFDLADVLPVRVIAWSGVSSSLFLLDIAKCGRWILRKYDPKRIL